MTKLLALIAAAGAASAAAVPNNLKQCGSAYYDPAAYTCYDGFLCPVVDGDATLKCGSACYSKYQYKCANGLLSSLPGASGPFTLTALAPAAPSLNGKTIVSAGQQFSVGGQTASYCPQQVGASCPPGKDTVLYAGSGLNTEVPGGQQYFIGPDGKLSFTQAHSAYYPTGSTFGVSAFEKGKFLYTGNQSTGWLACPNQYGTNPVIYVDTPKAKKDGCTPLTILIKPYTGPNPAVWQYS